MGATHIKARQLNSKNASLLHKPKILPIWGGKMRAHSPRNTRCRATPLLRPQIVILPGDVLTIASLAEKVVRNYIREWLVLPV